MMSISRARMWLVATILIAFGLRIHFLGAQSLWYDETVSTYLAQQPLADLLAHTARDIHPPFYYVLLHAWFQLVMPGPALAFLAAFPSLCWGVLLLPLTYVTGRRFGLARRTATWATLLAAGSAYQIWYSQEVRMYTLGAALGLLCLWAMCRVLASGGTRPGDAARRFTPRAGTAWALYVTAAVLGLYSLYYFAFLLIALNLIAWALLRDQQASASRDAETRPRFRRLGPAWLAAQGAVLLLFAPWLPVAWRQITQPPVPPWRTPVGLLSMLRESLLALGFGQSLPAPAYWPAGVLLAGLLLAALAVRPLTGPANDGAEAADPMFARVAFVLYTFVPLAIIITLSLAVVPLYHVRYIFTYAPPFCLLLAAGLTGLGAWRAPRGTLAAAAVVLLGLNGLSLYQAWHDPQFAADDHRAAVAYLSSRWRPGDIILVNAGYTYTALLTYWDRPVSWRGRLSDLDRAQLDALRDAPGAVIVQAGSVDGSPALGWGDPQSDFYAMSAEQTVRQIALLGASSRRLWQYRVYDTVTDPEGVIRHELDHWTLFDDQVFGGEANLRVQGYWSARAAAPFERPVRLAVGAGLTLELPMPAGTRQASGGSALNVPLIIRADRSGSDRSLATSLRLQDSSGQVWAQHDEALGGNVAGLDRVDALYQPLELTVPPGTAPGRYQLLVVMYDASSGQPLGPGATVRLPDDVAVEPTVQDPEQTALATFDSQVALVRATTPATTISPGDAVPLDLLWQATPAYRPELLVVVVQLVDDKGDVAASLEAQPLNGRYASDRWLPGELVRDRHELATLRTVRAGTYRLVIGLYRARDRSRLIVPCGPFGLQRCDVVEVGTLHVKEKE